MSDEIICAVHAKNRFFDDKSCSSNVYNVISLRLIQIGWSKANGREWEMLKCWFVQQQTID